MREGRAAAVDARGARRGARALPRPPARGRPLKVALAAFVVLATLVAGTEIARRSDWYASKDFSCLWYAARLAAQGQDPYAREAWSGLAAFEPAGYDEAASSCYARYAYPLWTALAMAPLGLLPLEVASSAWASLAVGSTAVGSFLVWRAVGGGRTFAALFGALAVSSQPFWILLISGQIVGVLVGTLGAAAWLLARGHRLAGIPLAALALKPQIAGLAVPAVLLSELRARRWGTGVVAVIAGAMMVLVSVAARPAWPAEWLDDVVRPRLGVAGALPSAWGLTADLGGPPAFAVVLVVALAAASFVLLRGAHPTSVEVAAVAWPVSLFAVPHVWSYDFLTLEISWALALAVAARSSGLTRAALLVGSVAVASLLPWALYAVAMSRRTETWSAVIPAVTALLAAAAVAAARRPPVS